MFEGIKNLNNYVKSQIDMQNMYKKIQENQQMKETVNKAETNRKLSAIVSKMRQGKKLSSIELAFLRNNNSSLYKKALLIKNQREQLEKRLKTCKDKTEFTSMRALVTQTIAAPSDIVTTNTDNFTLSSGGSFLYSSLDDAYRSYKQSAAYKKLPQTYRKKLQNQ